MVSAVTETSFAAFSVTPLATLAPAVFSLRVTATAAATVLAPAGAVVTVAPVARLRKFTTFSALACTSPV